MESIWRMESDIKPRESLQGDIESEVAVIGAGMAGILTAYALLQSGKEAVVLEAGRIAGGQTQNTTAKITMQHGLIYHTLVEKFGKESAEKYADINQTAVNEYKSIISANHIDCDFEEQCSYVYSQSSERLRNEESAISALKLDASFVTSIPIPMPCFGAIKFENQAQFNPLKFISAISSDLTIYENTAVKSVTEENTIITDHGRVRAKHIVFACHYPFINFPGLYFTKMYQERSYVLALKNARQSAGMFVGDSETSYSVRNYGNLLLFGGEKHRTGENPTGDRYAWLVRAAKRLYPGCAEVARWSAQDCITPDGLPYIGRYSRNRPSWYVATGFQKWGMSLSMVSAMVLRDLICKGSCSYEKLFSPSRFSASDLIPIAAQSAISIKGIGKQLLASAPAAADKLPRGKGAVVSLNGRKVGAYRDDDGKMHIVDTRCPHMGCRLEWNQDELSWDCPCHGSRFDVDGNLITNPAQTGIKIK